MTYKKKLLLTVLISLTIQLACILAQEPVVDYYANGYYDSSYESYSACPSFAPGRFGNALKFDGKQKYFYADNSDSLNLKDALSLSVWIKGTDCTSSWCDIITKGGNENRNYGLSVARYTGLPNQPDFGVPIFVYMYDGIGKFYVSGTDSVLDGKWHHITATYDGTRARLYVDTIEHSNPALDYGQNWSEPLKTNSNPLYIGGISESYWDPYFNGDIDNVAIFNRVLSEDEINRLYAAGEEAQISGAVLSLDFNEVEESVKLKDKSSHSNNARCLNNLTKKTLVYKIPITPNVSTGPVAIPQAGEEINIPTMPNLTNENVRIICMGCPINQKCYPIGHVKQDAYCADEGNFKNQAESNGACENNFECKSNVCVSKKCLSQGLIERIIEWFKKLFGAE